MKTTNPTKKGNKIVSALAASIIAIIGLVNTTLPASAADSRLSQSVEEKIFDICLYQCTEDGIDMFRTREHGERNYNRYSRLFGHE